MPIVSCPRCRAELDVDRSDLGHTVECPQCRSVFPAIAESRERTDDDRPRRYPDDDYGDRRHRDSDDPRDRARDALKAEEMVGKPVRYLATTAAIGIVVSIIGGVILGVVGAELLDQAGQQQQELGIQLVIYAICLGLFSPIYHIVMLVAAQKAKKLDGTGWAMTASIMGIGAIVLCGPCTIISIFTTWFGVWLLVAINKPEVARTIRWNKQPPARHRGSPLEDDDAPR